MAPPAPTPTPSATPSATPDLPSPTSPLAPFLGRIHASLADASFIRLVVSGPTPAATPVERIVGRLIDLRGSPVLSLTSREPRRDTTRNLDLPGIDPWLLSELGPRFRSALLETTTSDWQLALSDTRPPRLVQHRPRQTLPPPRTHDRPKSRTLSPDAADWLHALGLTDTTGRPLPSRTDKFQQIDRYTEILSHLVADCAWPAHAPVHIVDMGCGRGYLTFAAWQLLRRQLGFSARVSGIDARPELTAEAEALARRLDLADLTFSTGTIAGIPLEKPDALIALHACNTATDDALRRGIDAGCHLIVVAPCCHQQIRPQLAPSEPFTGPLQHGLLAERLAEWLTDALRSQFLEWAGYRVKAVEFVASEHTPKNLMLAGIRTQHPPFQDRTIHDRIVDLKARFGIVRHPLDPLLDRQ